MTKAVFLLLLVPALVFAQGQIIFQNNSATAITNLMTGQRASTATRVGFYLNPNSNAAPGSAGWVMIGSTNLSAPGVFFGGTRILPSAFPPGKPVAVQVRAWLTAGTFENFEAAYASEPGGAFAWSVVMQITPNDAQGTNAPPTLLGSGFQGFSGCLCPWPPVPGITISPIVADRHVVLSWPSTASGFVLESSISLLPNSWALVEPAPVIVGSQFAVTNPMSDGARFYRLKKYAPGQIIFQNGSTTAITNGSTGQRAATSTRVGFYINPNPNASQFSPGWVIIGNTNLFGPGIFFGGTRTLPSSFSAGTPVAVQVRAWLTIGSFDSFEAALFGELSGAFGWSVIMQITPTELPAPPSTLIGSGLQPFLIGAPLSVPN